VVRAQDDVMEAKDTRTFGLRASLSRVHATFVKELIQLRRDRITFAMMVVIPLVQLLLFGYAINTDPKHLPTAVLVQDDSVFTRSFMAGLRTSEYFDVRTVARGEDELDGLILSGAVQFGVQVPANFGRALIRGERPAILVVADATDPVATGSAVAALQGLSAMVFSRDLLGPAASLAPRRRRSRSGCTAATTRPARRGSTSCRGSWARS
jgi:ABC-2 type transport system permease protein